MKFLINNLVLNTRYATYTKLIEMQHGENNQPKQNNKYLSKDNAKIMLLPTSQPRTKLTNLELYLFLRFSRRNPPPAISETSATSAASVTATSTSVSVCRSVNM